MVLQLGAADVAASKRFYLDRGFAVAKSYGRRYVEFDSGPVTLTLTWQRCRASTDPDGFAWKAASS